MTIANTNTEYRDLPLSILTESKTNPRRFFEDSALNELAASIRSQGVLSPLLVRPLTERSFEIVAGARRYRAAQLAEAETVPVRIVNLTDAEALEAQLIENLQRRDVHPLEEAQGFRALLNLDEPKYSIEQIAAKTGKSPAYCAQRVKLTELTAAVTEAFAKDEIGVGHALLLAKLQPAEQEQALSACFREDWNGGQGKAKRILLPVRHLHQWIEQNILLILKDAPFSKTDPNLNPAAGACVDCPKRTGANALLFADIAAGRLHRPGLLPVQDGRHVAQTIAAKPKLVQISSAYGSATPPNEGQRGPAPQQVHRNQAARPQREEAQGLAGVPDLQIHDRGHRHRRHRERRDSQNLCRPRMPRPPSRRSSGQPETMRIKAEQEKQRREEAIANAVGLRVLSAIVAAVPVRLTKRDLLFIVERIASPVGGTAASRFSPGVAASRKRKRPTPSES